MQINIKLSMLLIVGLMVMSCQEQLEIQPEQSLSVEAAFENETAANASLMGSYSRMQSLNVYGSMPQIIGDFQTDNVNFIGSFPTLNDIALSSVIADNATTEVIFRDHYRAILAANAVIENVPGVDDPGFSDQEKAQAVAEAKFVRAFTNFGLVNLFAQPYTLDNGASPGIALVTDPSVLNSDFITPARSSVAETYNAIEQDLLEAVEDLPAENGRIRATSGAANALLSRLYLYKEDNQAAAARAQMVLDDPTYEVAPGYAFYDQLTPETILDIDMSPIDNSRTGSGGWAEFYNPAEAGARGDCPYSQDLLDSYEDGDLRFLSLHQYNDDSSLVYTTKFPQVATNADNTPAIRITEMYLNRAEALVKMNGVNQEAIDLINVLRVRAGLDEFEIGDFATSEELLDAVLDERRKELAFEGHRRMDQLRNGRGILSLMPGDDQVVMPIPVREIDLGSSLPQNPGY